MTVSAEVESLIADAPVSAHLATSVDDRPHVAPVWYGYRDGVVHFITGGRKLANMRRNHRVAMSIERSRDGDVEWNVSLRGTATIHDDPDRIDSASSWIYDKYDGDGDDETSSDEAPDDENGTTDGDSSAEQRDVALVEVTVGSGSANVYE